MKENAVNCNDFRSINRFYELPPSMNDRLAETAGTHCSYPSFYLSQSQSLYQIIFSATDTCLSLSKKISESEFT